MLSTVFKKRKEPPFAGAKAIFQYILENSAEKLAFQPADRDAQAPGRAINLWTMGNLLTPSYPLCGPPTHSQQITSFATLVSESLELGLVHQVDRLTETSCGRIQATDVDWGLMSKESAAAMLQALAFSLQDHKAPPTASAGTFFEVILRNCLLFKPLPYPKRPPGRTHRRRGCGCGDCDALDTFLVSAEQASARFSMGEPRRKHLDSRLVDNLFQRETDKSRVPHTLVVTKLGKEFSEDLRQFRLWLQGLDRMMEPLRIEYVRELLGDSNYRELVLLETIRGGEPLPGVAGAKRPASSPQSQKVSQRPRV